MRNFVFPALILFFALPNALAQTPKPTPPKVAPPAKVTTPDKPKATPYVQEASKKFPKTVTKLLVDDLQPGRGRSAKPGSRLAVNYSAWLYDPTQPLGRGPQFESTQGKAPYRFVLQGKENPHIRGWEEGIVDMKTGGRRRLIIPADMGYGANGAGQVIPAGATLLYEVELVEIE